jgi:alcohol dehydrogenase class IV
MEASIRLNAPHMNGRMEEFAKACGFDACGFDKIDEMIAQITVLKKRGGLPCTLKDAGIAPELVETLIKESFHPLMNNNPKEVTAEDLQQIYKEITG